MTFNRIVVPLDGTVEGESILPLARTLALGSGARVELVHVVDPDEIVVTLPSIPTAGYTRRVVTKPRREPLHSQMSEMVKRRFDRYFHLITETFRDTCSEITQHVLEGGATQEILKFAGSSQDTLLAISTRSASTRNLLTAARYPMLLNQSSTKVPSSQDKAALSTVLVYLDGPRVAADVLPCAVGIARKFGLKLLLVAAIPGMPILYEEEDLANPGMDWRTSILESKAYLSEVQLSLASNERQEVAVRILGGDSETQILDLASEIPGCLVALGSPGYSGMQRWLRGSVADRVIRSSPAPVLAVRTNQEQDKSRGVRFLRRRFWQRNTPMVPQTS
ncbi:MAG: hypothetical protein BZY67_01280 [SAR202 cluster bacterium Io17-Chloro-G1]|nr:MAG: hypothetical protein BZY67_01280 [SAR202 cluster bacterium Io17-Chloro-G1]